MENLEHPQEQACDGPNGPRAESVDDDPIHVDLDNKHLAARGQKRKQAASSRSGTPSTVMSDDALVGGDASARSSETPVTHKYGKSRLDEDARLRVVARMGTRVQGSGDGLDCGEECFMWTDLPMNRLGQCPSELAYSSEKDGVA